MRAMRPSQLVVLLVLLVLAVGTGPPATAATGEGILIDSTIFGALRARPLGPAVMSGRVAALDAVSADPRILYVGAASGGIWKSENGGTTFTPVFDEHCQSIGALCIDQAHPDTVWAGTGEPWVRNSVSVGDGVYRTTDGGRSWDDLGLAATERIGRIAIDPRDPGIVYVAALGPLWCASEARGLFRTDDGGQSWQKVLYVDENTGCADVALVPGVPNVVFAAMWDHRRRPDFFRSGGPGSGLYRSLDGGRNWQRLKEGLPDGELGRIALAVSPARPSRLFAMVESAASGFYRSDDMGQSWQRVSDQRPLIGRPFYFALVVADPRDPDRVYKPGTLLHVSHDGGGRWSVAGASPHVDYHALWIDPNDPAHMYAGNDGGLYVTSNRGTEWLHCANLPIAQFYRVSVDDAQPYFVYGGLQDNGCWRGPSRSPGGIENSDWENLGGGDGFCVLRDDAEPQIVYWEWQGGNVSRLHLDSGDTKDIKPVPVEGEPELRFNWNTPLVHGRADPSRLYIGSQYVHRSTDRGESWQRISPDLTTSDPRRLRQEESGGLTVDNTTAENHCTLYTIAESPLDGGVIWAGSDDGNLQVTGDDGAQWRSVADRLPGVPAGTWISCVETSAHERATAYVTCDGHRSGDQTPYVLRTRDLGESWESLATGDLRGYCHVIREDPENPDLLFLGTESGLFITVDGGIHWAAYEDDFPPVPVMDLAIQARQSDLVIATHGRGIWIIDDYRPLRHLTREGLAQDVFLLPSPPAHQTSLRSKQHYPGDGEFVGRNPSEDARIIYYLRKRHLMGEMKLEILSPEGELIKTLPGGKRKGINVVDWPMRLKPPRVTSSGVLDPYVSFAGSVGPAAPEGTYTYRLTKSDRVYEGTLQVVADPGSPHGADDRQLQQRTVRQLYDLLEEISYVVEALRQARDDARQRTAAPDIESGLRKRLASFADDAQQMRLRYIAPDEEIQGIHGIKRLRENLVRLYAAVAMYSGRPSESQLGRVPHFRRQIAAAREQMSDFLDDRLASLNERLQKAKLAPIAQLSFAEFQERD
jgi:photosystem II stability/assembly factor-like uncharacterized protein